MRHALCFCFLAASLSPAVAARQERTARVGVNNDPAQIICRAEREIGSRLRANRVCRTRAEWDDYRRATRRSVEQAQNERQSGYEDPPFPR